MTTLFLTTGIALAASFVLTLLVRRAAIRWEIVDRPDGHRKLHVGPIPLGGGIAVLASFGLAVAAALLTSNPWGAGLLSDPWLLAGLGVSALVLCGVGLVDDWIGLRGRQKLCGQILAAGILIASGLLIEKIQIFDWRIELGLLAVPFTLFWLLGAINALNLLDGVDGLATGVGMILSLALAGMAYLAGRESDALLALAFAGSLTGFLYHNFPPARIYLGDAGSMLIGLILGALAIQSSLKGPATVALAAPTAIWAIPIFDVAMAILRRKLTGRSIYTTDRGHLHHCLQRRGFSGVKTLAWFGILCGCTAVGALISIYRQNELLAIGSTLAVLCVLVVSGFFGHQELLLLSRRVKALVVSLVPSRGGGRDRAHEMRARLDGTGQWEDLWETLVEFAKRFEMSAVQLNVHLPAVNEEFHAQWKSGRTPDDRELWHTDIPLVVEGLTVGRLQITGARSEGSVCEWMGELIAGLKPFETQMQDIAATHLLQRPAISVAAAADSDVTLAPAVDAKPVGAAS